MKKIPFSKRLSIYLSYRKILLENKDILEASHNIRIDSVNRMYTVLNIPKDAFEEPYNFKKSDIDKISEPYIKDYFKKLSSFLETIGMFELYKLYDLKKVDKYSYLIVFGFSLFNTQKLAKDLLTKVLPISIVFLILCWFFILR